ncbi:hypothetical protein COU58_01255 [Candidatus Pacearchaeota archaeon CG10_big_fil_rev_8_21_14_0_10_32_42]|nr:MAG: hypothetical protein COU58_01255 [Candidatus Pacearchaeota archaeon CG10_big_fil_rev_8_21_14_0_10_32_42]
MSKKGQVWIETVTYTLVAFVLIGLILAFVKPKIDELQDKALIEQSLNIMRQIDSIINEVYGEGTGNKRLIEILVKKGKLTFDTQNDSLRFEFEGKYQYSQDGQNYSESSFDIKTIKFGSVYRVLIEKEYSNFNFTYGDKDIPRVLSGSSTPYRIFISNKGGAGQVIDFSLQ